MPKTNTSYRALQDFYDRAEEQKQKNLNGHFAGHGGTAYTPEAHRALSNAPTNVSTRTALQNTSGQILKRPNDDGTTTAGTWGIDEWGRVVAL